MTHPAFISMNTNGLWVAKFETTGDIANLSVKPGVTSLRSQTVKSMFEAAYNYKRDNVFSYVIFLIIFLWGIYGK